MYDVIVCRHCQKFLSIFHASIPMTLQAGVDHIVLAVSYCAEQMKKEIESMEKKVCLWLLFLSSF